MDLLFITLGASLLTLGLYGSFLAGKLIGLKQAYNCYYGYKRYSYRSDWWQVGAGLVAVMMGTLLLCLALV